MSKARARLDHKIGKLGKARVQNVRNEPCSLASVTPIAMESTLTWATTCSIVSSLGASRLARTKFGFFLAVELLPVVEGKSPVHVGSSGTGISVIENHFKPKRFMGRQNSCCCVCTVGTVQVSSTISIWNMDNNIYFQYLREQQREKRFIKLSPSGLSSAQKMTYATRLLGNKHVALGLDALGLTKKWNSLVHNFLYFSHSLCIK